MVQHTSLKLAFLHGQAPTLLTLKEEHEGQGYDSHGEGYADTYACNYDLGHRFDLADLAGGSRGACDLGGKGGRCNGCCESSDGCDFCYRRVKCSGCSDSGYGDGE